MERVNEFEVECDDVIDDVPITTPITHVGAAGDGLALIELQHADAVTAFVLPALRPGAARGARQAWLLAVEAEVLRWCPSCKRVSVAGAAVSHAGGCPRHERRYALWLAVEPPLRVMAASIRKCPPALPCNGEAPSTAVGEGFAKGRVDYPSSGETERNTPSEGMHP